MFRAKQCDIYKGLPASKAHSPHANISSGKPSLSFTWSDGQMGLTTHLQLQGGHMTEASSLQSHLLWDMCSSDWKRQSVSSGLVIMKM